MALSSHTEIIGYDLNQVNVFPVWMRTQLSLEKRFP